jgi:hypothetical protein
MPQESRKHFEQTVAGNGSGNISPLTHSGKVVSYITGIFSDFLSLPDVHEKFLTELVETHLTGFRELPLVDDRTYERLSPILADNTRYLFSREWIVSWYRASTSNSRLGNLTMVLSLIVVPGIAVLAAIMGHHVTVSNYSTFAATLVILILFGLLARLIRSLLLSISRHHLEDQVPLVMAFISVTTTSYCGTRSGWISLELRRLRPSIAPQARATFTQINWAAATHNALWILASLYIVRSLYVLSRYAARFPILSQVRKTSREAVYSISIQDNLLYVATTLNSFLALKEKDTTFGILDDKRRHLVARIEGIARTIEGPWVKSLRTGFRSTDMQIYSIARRIASTVRGWEILAVLGGEHLPILRDKCSVAYMQAVDGNWEQIAEGDELHELRTVRLISLTRRIATILLPIPAAIAALRLMRQYLASYSGPILAICTLLSIIELVVLIDPNILDRINTVLNITNSVRRGQK